MKEGLRRLAVVLKIFAWSWLALWIAGGGIATLSQQADQLAVFGLSAAVGAIGFAMLWPLGWIVDGFSRNK